MSSRSYSAECQVYPGIISDFSTLFNALEALGPIAAIIGSARIEPPDPYYELTQKIAKALSQKGYAIITGGGTGLMKAANEGAYEGPAASIGLPISDDPIRSHVALDYVFQIQALSLRKQAFIECAEAIVCLPGGFGTLDEWSEILLVNQYFPERAKKTILVGSDFWAPVIQWFEEQLLAYGLISQQDLDAIVIVDTVEDVLSFFPKT